MKRFIAVLTIVALCATAGALAATNSLDTFTQGGTILGGQTNMVTWSLNFTPATVYVTPYLRNVFVAQTREPRIVKLGTAAMTNSAFTIVTQSNTVSYTLGGHDTLWIMSTNAVTVTNTYDLTFVR